MKQEYEVPNLTIIAMDYMDRIMEVTAGYEDGTEDSD